MHARSSWPSCRNASRRRSPAGSRGSLRRCASCARSPRPTRWVRACERQKMRALVDYFARDWRAAAAASEKAIDMSREAGLTYEVAVNLHNLGDILVRVNDLARAYGAIQQSLALCEESGYERLASH